MADLGYIRSEINSLPAELKPTFVRIFTALLKDLRFGHAKGEQPDPLLNFGGGFFHVTTAAVPGDEFTIPHGFGRTPYLAIPCLLLDVVGSSVGPLTVSRVADDKRIYLTSTETSLPVSVIVEG